MALSSFHSSLTALTAGDIFIRLLHVNRVSDQFFFADPAPLFIEYADLIQIWILPGQKYFFAMITMSNY